MLDETLEEKYSQLKKQANLYSKHVRRSKWLFVLAFTVYLVLFVYIFTEVFFLDGLSDFDRDIITPSTMVCVFILMFAHLLPKRKSRAYNLEAEDWIFYHTYSILESLAGYDKSSSPRLREEYRKKAVESARELLVAVENGWKLGDFKLARTMFGNAVSEILDTLRSRVIPNLEKGDEETLKKVDHSLSQFAHYFVHPSLERLQHVNKSISESLNSLETTKLGLVARCSAYFKTHTTVKHVAIVGAIFSVAIMPIVLANHYGPISIESALLGFSAIFGPTIAVYLSYALKHKE